MLPRPGDPNSVSFFRHCRTQGRRNGARESHGFRRPELPTSFSSARLGSEITSFLAL